MSFCRISPRGLSTALLALALGAAGCNEVDLCQNVTCSHGGTCEVASNMATCKCATGYQGALCQSCAPGYKQGSDGTCTYTGGCAVENPCQHGATCDDASGSVVCTCPKGYAGAHCESCAAAFHDDGSGTCVPDATCLSTTCSGHGTCTASGATLTCACQPGYAGEHCESCAEGFHHDASGGCAADEACTDGVCGHGACEVSGGVVVCTCEFGFAGARCDGCAAGFHADGAGGCVLDEKCLGSTCSGHGTCAVTAGLVSCACESGYTGPFCGDCDTGFHRTLAGTCAANEACTSGVCGHGTCDAASGVIQCACELGWAGERCAACAGGYHSDGAGGCVLDDKCLPSTCSGHGECAVTGGAVACDCDDGYAGLYCAACASGYHWTASGTCAADVACTGDTCTGHGSCADDTGLPVCTCSAGWAGAFCNACASGYHAAGNDCVLDEQCRASSCSGHGDCSATGGVVACACQDGYAGSLCQDCAADYHRVADGTCAADATCAAGSCAHGQCSDTTGVVVCACDRGWAGAACDACAPGFHLTGGDCVLDQQCLASTCSGHGDCAVTGGVVGCTCADGYDGDFCQTCDAGWHRNLQGACVADETCAADSCSGRGVCSSSTGLVVCSCNTGYAGARCELCAAGYHAEGPACVLDEVCQPGTCNGHGTCSDLGGVVRCQCDEGSAPPYCAQCYPGYVVNGLTRKCELPCENWPDIRCNGVCTPGNAKENCGACGKACALAENCVFDFTGTSAGCVCPRDTNPNIGNCPSEPCVDFSLDERNCGACGHACLAGEKCISGACRANDSFCAEERYCTGESDLCCAGACLAGGQWTPSHCGACGVACQGAEICETWGTAGWCACPTGEAFRRDCAGSPCVNVLEDEQNCGACGAVCGAGQKCANGTCQSGDGTCLNCSGTDQICCNSVCISGPNAFLTDRANCGGCGIACPAGTQCTGGQCVGGDGSCGYGNPCAYNDTVCCNTPTGAWCVDLNGYDAHCGACGRACQPGERCDRGRCRCDATQCGDECVPSLDSDDNHCGACGHACEVASGERCVAGRCVVPDADCGGSCSESQLCCQGVSGPECLERYALHSNQHCGGCAGCSGLATCQDGLCKCSGAHQQECGGVCVDTFADEANCGGCGLQCDAQAGERCVFGTCQAPDGTCAFGCSSPDNLCCASFQSSLCLNTASLTEEEHCGGCSPCQGANRCMPDPAGAPVCVCPDLWEPTRFALCAGQCLELNDHENCGGCGLACASTEVCIELDIGLYECQCPSDPQHAVCDGACVEVLSDGTNCGQCGVRCGAGEICGNGTCMAAEPEVGDALCLDGVDNDGTGLQDCGEPACRSDGINWSICETGVLLQDCYESCNGLNDCPAQSGGFSDLFACACVNDAGCNSQQGWICWPDLRNSSPFGERFNACGPTCQELSQFMGTDACRVLVNSESECKPDGHCTPGGS